MEETSCSQGMLSSVICFKWLDSNLWWFTEIDKIPGRIISGRHSSQPWTGLLKHNFMYSQGPWTPFADHHSSYHNMFPTCQTLGSGPVLSASCPASLLILITACESSVAIFKIWTPRPMESMSFFQAQVMSELGLRPRAAQLQNSSFIAQLHWVC